MRAQDDVRGMRFVWLVALGLLWTAVVAVVLMGHTAAVGPVTPDPRGPGFLLGLWHGLILPVSFVLSLLRDDVAIYAAVHDGHADDVGFVVGVLVMTAR